MVNHVTLQGRLVRDPELRSTGSGVSVCSFTVAWSEKYKENETKLFLPCTAWRSTGEMVSKYFRKGQEIAVEGKLSTREWTDKDGNKRSSNELTADRVHFCGPKQWEGGNAPESELPGHRTTGSGVNVAADDFADFEDDGALQF